MSDRTAADPHSATISAASTGLAKASLLDALELPTWVLIAVVYGGWLALTWYHAAVDWWVLLVAGAWLTAWHMSLQHEVLHGHPTRSRAINTLLGFPPLSLWLPYERYRETHIAHHRDELLTDPFEDPESYYVTAEAWARRSRLRRAIDRFATTFVGRLTVGPARTIILFLAAEARLLLAGDRRAWAIWSTHAIGVAAVLYWVLVVCGMPLWVYLACFVYPGMSLGFLRSFAEHRAALQPEHRTAIVERTPLGLLFLHNNLHVVHHEKPGLPWYRIPAAYRAGRDAYLDRNGGLLYRGYWEVARKYFLRMHHEPVHPFVPPAGDLSNVMVIVQTPAPPSGTRRRPS